MKALTIDENTSILVLTGAGVSAESGLPTYRGTGGYWRNHRFEDVASIFGFKKDPAVVWQFYSERREAALAAKPNEGHLALARLEAQLGDRFLLATQNVDGLHQKAGSKNLVELHGNLFYTKCSVCSRPTTEDLASYHQSCPSCERCFAPLRPQVTWFGEQLDSMPIQRVGRFMLNAEKLVFLAVGTSGTVFPAASLVDVANEHGADTFLIDSDPRREPGAFKWMITGKAAEVLPDLFP